MTTNWSAPKTNVFAGMLELRRALAAGMNAKLIRARNEDCGFPIKEKYEDEDFRNYEFRSAYIRTRQEIIDDNLMSDFQKYLTLNYKTCYGTAKAKKRYYEKGLLSKDNIKGVGTAHLVKIKDLIPFMITVGNNDTDYLKNDKRFYDNYTHISNSPWAIKQFKKRLWVIELLDKNKLEIKTPFLIKILNVILYPTKFIPIKSVLSMNEYKCVTFRIGDVINGFCLEFRIPKKFSFK